MSVLQQIENWLTQEGLGRIETRQPLSGGSICACIKITTTDGHFCFAKYLMRPPEGLFAAEAAGLNAIAAVNTIRTPKVYHHTNQYLLLEYLEPGEKIRNYWESLGTQLALLHQSHGPGFGFDINNYCGTTPQPNPLTDNGHQFFATHRLMYQANLALNRHLLCSREHKTISSLAARLPDLIPEQPASLIHGDLWSGNAYCSSPATPTLIDPACYWGWAEAELAMTRLFGGFPDTFYQAYESCNPFESGWKQRLALYNLYHLLNHLNLFGASYHSRVIDTINRYI